MLRQISVNRTIHVLHDTKVVFRQPKTQKSRRMVALSPPMAGVLREHRDSRAELGVPVGDDDLAFCHVDRSHLMPDSVSHAWMRLARLAGTKGLRLHNARHTHATLMLKQGPKLVQERLGHAMISTTLDIYSHVTPGLQQAAAAQFDDTIVAKPAGTSQA